MSAGCKMKKLEDTLETHIATDDSLDSRLILEDQLRECYGRVVYTHKTHEKCADVLQERLAKIKLWQIVLSALTTSGFVASILGGGKPAAVIGIVISTALLVLNAYTKNYNLGELAQKHRAAGADLWIIREKYLSLITDLRMGEKPLETLQKERDALLERLHGIYVSAPSTTFKGYQRAQKALKEMEDKTFSEKEIDAFLPGKLKRSS